MKMEYTFEELALVLEKLLGMVQKLSTFTQRNFQIIGYMNIKHFMEQIICKRVVYYLEHLWIEGDRKLFKLLKWKNK
jgi:hypothetical protein